MSGIELAPGSKIFTTRCKNLYVLTTTTCPVKSH
ncbi:hypothetical protein MTR67_006946 [Solanum verrucosum]|uniref:Uncharacterized protein n=1 Tax=Solanum verrucosum TaxID=315347 RepID=A0AAF0PZ13_SOLVR|nr:hypothetical protein MTR67_006946 [Solanum verrucosum]